MPEEPVFTLEEVVDLERPAWHRARSGDVDFIFDGINFWHEVVGKRWSVERRGPMPQGGWHHKKNCRCPRCHEAKSKRRRGAA